MNIIENKEELEKFFTELKKKVDFVRSLPMYDEYIKLKEEYEGFTETINNRREDKTFAFIKEFIGDPKKVEAWIERIKKLEKRLSDSEWKKGYSFCSSNIMDHVWEVVKKHGKETEVDSMFGNYAYSLGGYIMETYSGQGEYGYAIYTQKRIF